MNNSKYKNDFENLYITLEKMLHKITGIPDHIPVFPHFRAILEEPYYSQMETICNYRNACYGHGVKIGGERPVAPKEWIEFLKKEIWWLRNNQEYVKERILQKVHIKKPAKVTEMWEIQSAVECELAISKVLNKTVYTKDAIGKIINFCEKQQKEGIVVLYNVLKVLDDSDTDEDFKEFCARFLIERADGVVFNIEAKRKFNLLRGRYVFDWNYDEFNCNGFFWGCDKAATRRQKEYFQKYLSIVLKYVPDYERSHLIE